MLLKSEAHLAEEKIYLILIGNKCIFKHYYQLQVFMYKGKANTYEQKIKYCMILFYTAIFRDPEAENCYKMITD